MDLISYVQEHPPIGATITGISFEKKYGGKGIVFCKVCMNSLVFMLCSMLCRVILYSQEPIRLLWWHIFVALAIRLPPLASPFLPSWAQTFMVRTTSPTCEQSQVSTPAKGCCAVQTRTCPREWRLSLWTKQVATPSSYSLVPTWSFSRKKSPPSSPTRPSMPMCSCVRTKFPTEPPFRHWLK